MPRIDESTIKHVAALSRLRLTAAEARRYQADLEEILKAFDVLKSVPTECEPSFQPIGIDPALRNDSKEDSLSHTDALSNTKHKEKGFFKGPKAV